MYVIITLTGLVKSVINLFLEDSTMDKRIKRNKRNLAGKVDTCNRIRKEVREFSEMAKSHKTKTNEQIHEEFVSGVNELLSVL